MPFKSEKQRRYLWANEPEVARKWAHESLAHQARGGERRKGKLASMAYKGKERRRGGA